VGRGIVERRGLPAVIYQGRNRELTRERLFIVKHQTFVTIEIMTAVRAILERKDLAFAAPRVEVDLA